MKNLKWRRMHIRIGQVLYNDEYWKGQCYRMCCNLDVVSHIEDTTPSVTPEKYTKHMYENRSRLTYCKLRRLEDNCNNGIYKYKQVSLKNINFDNIKVQKDGIMIPNTEGSTFIVKKECDSGWTTIKPSYFQNNRVDYILHAYNDIFAIAADTFILVYEHIIGRPGWSYYFKHYIEFADEYSKRFAVSPTTKYAITFCDGSVVTISTLPNGDYILMAWDLYTGKKIVDKIKNIWQKKYDNEQITDLYFVPQYCKNTVVVNIKCNDVTATSPDLHGILIVFYLDPFKVHLHFQFELYANCLYLDEDAFAVYSEHDSTDMEIRVYKSHDGSDIVSKYFGDVYIIRESVQVVNEYLGFLTPQSHLLIFNKFYFNIIVFLELGPPSESLTVSYQLLQHSLFAYAIGDIVKVRRIAKYTESDLYELKKFRGTILGYKNPVHLYILNTARNGIYLVRFL